MPTTSTTTTTTPRTWWRWDQAPAGVLVFHLNDDSPCPACAAPLRVTRDEHDAQDVECTACAWAQGFEKGFVWARRP